MLVGISIFLTVLVLIYLYMGWYFSGQLIFPRTFDHEYAIAYDTENGRVDPCYYETFLQMEKQEVMLTSDQGYELHGLWIPNGNSNKTVVFCHGITWNLIGAIKYSEIFYRMGFNLLLYDHRNHGKSGGSNTTFGYFEKRDLKLWIDWVEQKLGTGTMIGTHGESLGAATVLQHLEIDSRISFCIADCPYSDLKELLRYRLSMDYKIKTLPLLPIASIFAKLRTGMSISAVSPINAIKNIETPIFWIHGADDLYVPPSMSEAMYQAKSKGLKRIWIVEGAKHAGSYYKNREAYYQEVKAFLKEIEDESH